MIDTNLRIEKIELVTRGEIAMGSDSYGIRIETNSGNFDNFTKLPVLVGHDDYEGCTEVSTCNRYFLITGAFTTWILDIKDQAISVYKTTIRTEDAEWSEEQAIFGKHRHHISSFDRHYYLQFPFVDKDKFEAVYQNYTTLRIRQIYEATHAL
jgi:hypothetical protein